MDIEHLKYFYELAKTKNFTIAAENLFTSQSVVSKKISSLEKELNVQLFDRTTRKTSLSKAGEYILPFIESILTKQEEMLHRLTYFKSGNQNKLLIGALPVMYYYHIIELVSSFGKSHPEIKYELIEYNEHNIVVSLEKFNFELGFWGEGFDDRNVDKIPFFKDELVVVLPKNHPHANDEVIDLYELRNERFCFMDKRTPIYNMSINTCIKAKFKPNIYFTCVRPENAIGLVNSGNCVAMMMREYTQGPYSNNVVVKPISPTFSRTIYLIKLKNRKLSKSAQVFWDFILQKNKLKAK